MAIPDYPMQQECASSEYSFIHTVSPLLDASGAWAGFRRYFDALAALPCDDTSFDHFAACMPHLDVWTARSYFDDDAAVPGGLYAIQVPPVAIKAHERHVTWDAHSRRLVHGRGAGLACRYETAVTRHVARHWPGMLRHRPGSLLVFRLRTARGAVSSRAVVALRRPLGEFAADSVCAAGLPDLDAEIEDVFVHPLVVEEVMVGSVAAAVDQCGGCGGYYEGVVPSPACACCGVRAETAWPCAAWGAPLPRRVRDALANAGTAFTRTHEEVEAVVVRAAARRVAEAIAADVDELVAARLALLRYPALRAAARALLPAPLVDLDAAAPACLPAASRPRGLGFVPDTIEPPS